MPLLIIMIPIKRKLKFIKALYVKLKNIKKYIYILKYFQINFLVYFNLNNIKLFLTYINSIIFIFVSIIIIFMLTFIPLVKIIDNY